MRILALLIVVAGPAWAEVPILDARGACDGMSTLTGVADTSACMADEKAAMKQVAPVWDRVPPEVQADCLGQSVPGLPPLAYVGLRMCLDFKLDLF